MEVAKLVLEYIHELVWPCIVLFAIILFRVQLEAAFARLRKAALPGGVALDFGEAVKEAMTLSAEVESEARKKSAQTGQEAPPRIPITEANARLLQLGLRPSPSGLDMTYYRKLSSQDPNLALAGLRIEVDVLVRNLAEGFGVPVDSQTDGEAMLRCLFESKAITRSQRDLASSIVRLCNAAIHGQKVTALEADAVIEIAKVLADQYISWLSWGFKDGWKPKEAQPAAVPDQEKAPVR